jgi:predicted transglutaminase-like cysteine proteinase
MASPSTRWAAALAALLAVATTTLWQGALLGASGRAHDDRRAEDPLTVRMETKERLSVGTLRLARIPDEPAVTTPSRERNLEIGEAVVHVAIPVGRLSIDDQWSRILANDPAAAFRSPCDADKDLCRSRLLTVWREWKTRHDVGFIHGGDLLGEINRLANEAIRFKHDEAAHGISDYWATPRETAIRGVGDCEDIAIVKLGMLTALGISPDAMQILVVKDARQGTGHAVLRVTLGGTGFLLDNQSNDVTSEDWQPWYKPLYAVAMTGKWIYGTVPVRFAAAHPE